MTSPAASTQTRRRGPIWLATVEEVDVRGRSALVTAAIALGMLAVPTAAMASGGVNSGGVNSGGGGTGGGGTGGGGGTTTTSGSCAAITSFSNSNGYYSVWAAIWTSFSWTNSCGAPVTMRMTYTNGTTGAVDFSAASSTMMNGTIDEDWAAFSTSYTVTMTLTDGSGAVLDSRSAVVTTKAPKSAGA